MGSTFDSKSGLLTAITWLLVLGVTEACTLTTDYQYDGSVSKTISGRTCQRYWLLSHMSRHTHARIHTHTHTHTYTCTHAHRYTNTLTHTHTHTHTRAPHIHTHIHTHTFTHIHTHTFTHTHTRTHTHTHTCTRTHTHAHTRTHSRAQKDTHAKHTYTGSEPLLLAFPFSPLLPVLSLPLLPTSSPLFRLISVFMICEVHPLFLLLILSSPSSLFYRPPLHSIFSCPNRVTDYPPLP
jgi:hypothetical protein